MPLVSRNRDHAVLSLAFLLFFVSGFSALLYQVIWQRMLALFGGSDVYSVTLIVASFMGGLGLGSLAGGHFADRVSIRGRIICFGAAELLVAVFAVLSKRLYYDLLYERVGELARSPAAVAPVLFASLLLPTFLMGTSLPLLSRALTDRVETAAQRIGALYGINTLGAAAGSFATVWFLVRTYDFETNLQIGAALNLLCAGGALVLVLALGQGASTRSRVVVTAASVESPSPSHERPGSFRFATWILVYGLSGLTALSLEIVWFRMLAVMAKATAFTFGNLLGIYLTGLATGTIAGLSWVRRSRNPASTFLALQAGIAAYVAVSVVLLVEGLGRWEGLQQLSAYLGQYEPIPIASSLQALRLWLAGPGDVAPQPQALALQFITLYFLLPSALIVPPTLMMGLSFPFLQKVVQQDTAMLGRRVGWLQTANIVGSMMGAFLTGWILLRVLGSGATLKLLVGFGALFGLLWTRLRLRAGPRRVASATAAFAGFAALAIIVPSSSKLWPALHGVTAQQMIFAEDESGLSVIKTETPLSTRDRRAVMYVNGSGESWIPYGGIHSWLGFLPALVHPFPAEIALIGLGSGDTLFYAGVRRETRTIICIEIVRSQSWLLREHHRRDGYPGLESIFTDSRVRFEFADGRAFLKRSPKRYDIIEADALQPYSANSGNLYSYEYFSLLRERLRASGLAVSWAPTPRVIDTFVAAFPHVLRVEFRDLSILIGGNEAIPYDTALIQARLEEPFTRNHFGRLGVDLHRLAERLRQAKVHRYAPDKDGARRKTINRDLFPRDEFLVRSRY